MAETRVCSPFGALAVVCVLSLLFMGCGDDRVHLPQCDVSSGELQLSVDGSMVGMSEFCGFMVDETLNSPQDRGHLQVTGGGYGIEFAFNGVGDLQIVSWPDDEGLLADGKIFPHEVEPVLPERGFCALTRVRYPDAWSNSVGEGRVSLEGTIPPIDETRDMTVELSNVPFQNGQTVSGTIELHLSWVPE